MLYLIQSFEIIHNLSFNTQFLRQRIFSCQNFGFNTNSGQYKRQNTENIEKGQFFK